MLFEQFFIIAFLILDQYNLATMEITKMKKMLEQLQAEFVQDAETLATLQNIYAEKVKQLRTNRTLPPDIQQRFLTEWEQFYQQRVSSIFAYDTEAEPHSDSDEHVASTPAIAAMRMEGEKSATDFEAEATESRVSKRGRA